MKTKAHVRLVIEKRITAEALPGIPFHAALGPGKEKELGSLAIGKQADPVILDIPDFRHRSHPFGLNHAWKVIKKGRLVWEAESAHSTIRVDPGQSVRPPGKAGVFPK